MKLLKIIGCKNGLYSIIIYILYIVQSRPELIVHSNLPIIQILCSHLSWVTPFFPIIQMSLPDYSNDYDLLFNSKEVFISAKTQFVTRTDILYFEKYRKVSELPSPSQSSTRSEILHPLTRTNYFRFTRAFSAGSSLSLGW